MGWGNCGTDSKGRGIGYMVPAKCDHPGCEADIDRGLSYACGGMHGQDEVSCELYFCEKHLQYTVDSDDHMHNVCAECAALLKSEGEWVDDDEEGTIVRGTDHV